MPSNVSHSTIFIHSSCAIVSYQFLAQTTYVIVISEFLKCHSKAKRTRTPAYSRAMRRIKAVFQRVGHGKTMSDFQRVRGDRVAGKVGVVYNLVPLEN